MAGDDFHEYEGPLGDTLDKWCFVCGNQSDFGVRLLGLVRLSRVVGVCKRHLAMLVELRPTEAGVPKPRFEVVTSEGKPVTLKRPDRKNSVSKAIYEVETYYAKKHGTEPDL
jgi:hypothetical protein